MKSNTQKSSPKNTQTSIADVAFDELAKNVIEFNSYLSHKNLAQFVTKLVDCSVKEQRVFIDDLFTSEKSINYMYEVFFPETARLLGNYWSQDLLSFCKVTIGISNLQILLKQYDHLYLEHGNAHFYSPSILLITPEKETHTFGSMLACRVFQKLGCSPFLIHGPEPKKLENIIKINDFSLIGISLADFNLIEEVTKLVAVIRNVAPVHCPIILGGEIRNWPEKSIEIPGLDAINSNPKDVLEMCELTPHSGSSIEKNIILNGFFK